MECRAGAGGAWTVTDGEGRVGGERMVGSGHQKACGCGSGRASGSGASETLPRSGWKVPRRAENGDGLSRGGVWGGRGTGGRTREPPGKSGRCPALGPPRSRDW